MHWLIFPTVKKKNAGNGNSPVVTNPEALG
jgi:hypothetical protein